MLDAQKHAAKKIVPKHAHRRCQLWEERMKRISEKNVNEKNGEAHLHKELTINIQRILNALEFLCSRFVWWRAANE